MTPDLALQRALIARLTATTDVTALVPASDIIDGLPTPARFPSILVGEGQVVREANTLAANHRRVYATLHVWAKGMPQARAIAGAITSAVQHQPLTLATGYRAISAVIASARFMRDEEEAHGVVTVDSLVEVTA